MQISRHPYLDGLGLIVNTRIRSLICEWCQVVVSPDRVKAHLKSPSHKDKNLKLKEESMDNALAAMNVAKTPPPPPVTKLSQPAPTPFQGLKLLEGFACTHCCQLGLSEGFMKNHYSRQHHTNMASSAFTRCLMQRYSMSQAGPMRALFRVESSPTHGDQPSLSVLDAVQVEMAAALDMPHLRNKTDQRCISPWLLTTKWHEHIQGYEVKELCALIAFPSKTEYPGLSAAVQEYFAEATDEMDGLQELTLQILNTADPVKTCVRGLSYSNAANLSDRRGINNTPLHDFQQDGTLNQYCTVIIRQLAMLMRRKTNYLIPLPSELQQSLDGLERSLKDQDAGVIQKQLHNIFMGLWKFKWQPTAENTIPCPTIRALALTTLRPDGHFSEPYQVTGIIAKWQRCIRLAFVKEMKQMSNSMEEEVACKTLQPWFTEKSLSPFNSLRSLQHRASAIAKTTMGLGWVLWVDRTNWTSLLYQGTSISLEQMVGINRAIEDRLIETWENKVLLGLKIRVDCGRIVENLNNTDVGYSFLTDTRNEPLKRQDRLLLAIAGNVDVSSQFLQFNPQTHKVIWNKSRLRQGLLDYSEFQQLALTRCELLAGGPGRSTEFTSMQQHNTPDRNTRNIHILDKYVAIIRQYHKSAQLTGQDTFIPHALDGVMADLIIQDLTLAKPFAQFAAHLCFPDQSHIQELYRDYLFVNNTQLFTVESITEILKDFTLPVLGITLGIQDWRHVAIAFKRKHCSEAMDLYEGAFSSDSIYVRQAGHSHALEDRLYGLSPDALLGVAEDMLPLFMVASTKWQVLHRAVPGVSHNAASSLWAKELTILLTGGLQLPYSEARAANFDNLVNSGVIQLNQAPHADGKTAVDIADQVVERLKPILVNLVCNTLQDVIKKTLEDALQEIQDKVKPHQPPPEAQSIAPITDVNDHIENNWDSMYIDVDSTPSIIVSPTSPHQSFPARSTSPEIEILPQPSWSAQNCSSSSLQDSTMPEIEMLPQSPRSAQPYLLPPPQLPLPTLPYSSPSSPTPVASVSSPETSTAESNLVATVANPKSSLSTCGSTESVVVRGSREAWPKHKHTLQDALSTMSCLLKISNPTWTCNEQQIAMQATLECQKDVLAIMRTSSGKSMLMVVPSLLENDKITIGIVPLNSLLLDYSRKFKAQGVPFQIFHSHDSPTLHGDQNLVLTIVDQARTKLWKQQIGELNQRRPVGRVVFDEGHYAITDQDFRGVLGDVHELRQFAVQMVVLSATIPPKSEATIREAFGLMDRTVVVRTPTRRPELKYIIEEPLRTNSSIADRVEAIIDEATQSLKGEDRILVFVPYLDNGIDLSEQLGCEFFCGGHNTSSKEKNVMYQNWVKGFHKVMVCTNAFGAGNDYSHVSLVIHAGTPRHMMGYIQESSRAGRNKQPSQCIIIPRSASKSPNCQDTIDHKGEQDMYDMLFGKNKETCINYALSLFNDGTGISCNTSWNGQMCSRCLEAKTGCPTKKGELTIATYRRCVIHPRFLALQQHPASRMTATVARFSLTSNPTLPSKRSYNETSGSSNPENPFQGAFQDSKRRKITKAESISSYVAKFRRALNPFRETCPICRARGLHNIPDHQLSKCDTLSQIMSPTDFISFKRSINYGKHHKHSICFYCHIPQINDQLHQT